MALTAGLAKDCNANSGGIKRIALANVADITTVSLNTASTAISTITMSATSVDFFEFEFEQDTAEWRENGEQVNGSLKYTEEVEFYVRKNNATNRKGLAEVGENLCGMVAAIEDTNGTTYFVGWTDSLGLERPLKLASDAGSTGKELTDLAGSTITLSCMSNEKAYPLEAATATTFWSTQVA